MARKDYGETVDLNDPVMKEAQEALEKLRPVGAFLYILGVSNWRIGKYLQTKDAKKNGLSDMCTMVDGELCCTWEQAQEWLSRHSKRQLRA